MIVTLTPNPSLDRSLSVPALHRGEVLRVSTSTVEPGGKGINVTRALTLNGHASLALLPVGGHDGLRLSDLLTRAGIPHREVTIAGGVRSNVAIVEPDGTVTKVNEPGPTLSADERDALLAATADAAADATWVVSCGSVPAGAGEELHARVVEAAHAAGARAAVDASGPAFVAALTAGPDLVKPNHDELAEAVGAPVRTLGDAVDACERLRAMGAGTVLASLGPDGALLVGEGVRLHAERPVDNAVSTVAAGDATLAGYLANVDDGPEAALRSAVAFGSAAVQLPGSALPGPDDLRPDAVRVTADLDLTRPLSAGTPVISLV